MSYHLDTSPSKKTPLCLELPKPLPQPTKKKKKKRQTPQKRTHKTTAITGHQASNITCGRVESLFAVKGELERDRGNVFHQYAQSIATSTSVPMGVPSLVRKEQVLLWTTTSKEKKRGEETLVTKKRCIIATQRKARKRKGGRGSRSGRRGNRKTAPYARERKRKHM